MAYQDDTKNGLSDARASCYSSNVSVIMKQMIMDLRKQMLVALTIDDRVRLEWVLFVG